MRFERLPQRERGQAFASALFAMLLLVPFAPGCTPVMWERANETTIYIDRVPGVLRATADAPQQLVVAGHLPDQCSEVFYLIPMASDGRPAAPFLYDGKARNLHTIIADVGRPSGRNQHPAVGRRVYDASLRRAPASSDPSKSTVYRAFSVSQPYGERPVAYATNGILVIAVRVGADGVLELVEGRCDRGVDDDVTWPGDALIVVVPSEQARPPRDIGAARVGAALMTPLTLCADVVLAPYIILMIATGHGC